MAQTLDSKLENLKARIKSMNFAVIAFSGGVDSVFLAKVAFDVLGKRAIAVTAASPTHPKRELKESRKYAKSIGIQHIVINTEETERPGFKENTPMRCYFCKKELFSKIRALADEKNIENVIDASNYNDLDDYRPGMMALKELNIGSPLKDAELTKAEIRQLSKNMGLDTWDKPAFACLASRFPYGTEITKENLEKVERAEDIIHNFGIKQLRVRFHGKIARIEVEKGEVDTLIKHSKEIIAGLKGLGFVYITLDLEGYRMGSLNEVL